MDMSMDGSPIIDRTHIDRLYFNGAGAMAVSKLLPRLAGAMPISWPRMPRMSLLEPIASTGLKKAK